MFPRSLYLAPLNIILLLRHYVNLFGRYGIVLVLDRLARRALPGPVYRRSRLASRAKDASRTGLSYPWASQGLGGPYETDENGPEAVSDGSATEGRATQQLDGVCH